MTAPWNATGSPTGQVEHGLENEECYFPKHEYLLVKFVLISVIGTTVAVLGICGNLAIVAVLMQPAMRTANNLYLTVLAVFDTLVLIPAIILYSLEYVNEYFETPDFYVTWIQSVPYCYSLSHFAQTGSVYITVSLTFERFLAVLHPKVAEVQCTRHRAIVTIVGVVCFAALFNCTKLFEIQVAHHTNCTGFASRELVASELLRNTVYSTVYSLWLTQFVMVFLPFGVLLTFNTAIAWSFKRSLRQLDYAGVPLDRNQLKEQSKDATRVLVTIVLVFLICNCWGFVTTLLESIYGNGALAEWAPDFYTFSREAINFLAIVNSSINFVICWTFGEDFRHELLKLCGCRRRRRRKNDLNDLARGSPMLQRIPRATAPPGPVIPGLRFIDRVDRTDEVSMCDEEAIRGIRQSVYTALINVAKNMVNESKTADRLDIPHHLVRHSPTLFRRTPIQANGYAARAPLMNRGDYDFSEDDFYLPSYYSLYPSGLRLNLETTI